MTGKPKTYIVTFVAADVNILALHQYIHDSREIIAYWNYIPLVYCLKSDLSALELRDRLRPFLNTYMIAEINERNLDGLLPSEAWSWFYMDHHEKRELPTGFGGLGGIGGLGGLFLPPPPKK
jgi:hypothetical protein